MSGLSLSWRHKLWALMILVPGGLVLVVGLVLWSGFGVGRAYHSLQQAFALQLLTTQMMADWALLEKNMAEQGPNLSGLERRLNALEQQGRSVQQQAEQLQDEQLQDLSGQGLAVLMAYADQRRQWQQLTEQLWGTEQQSGLADELERITLELDDASMGTVGESMRRLIDTQKNYLLLHTSEAASAAQLAIAEFAEILRQYGWEETAIGETFSAYQNSFGQLDELLAKLHQLSSGIRERANELQRLDTRLSDRIEHVLMPDALAQAQRAELAARNWTLASFGLFAPLLILVLFVISRTLVQRLEAVVQLLSAVAGGDLSRKLAIGNNSCDEFNQLGQAANTMIVDVARAISQAIDGTRSLQQVRQELANTMQVLVENNHSVEATTTEVASATEQIALTLNEVARRTAQVGHSTQTANNAAQAGAKVVESSTVATRALADLIKDTHAQARALAQSSSRVSGIIDVINGLADQTNLLALNAAIEAARAGEAGRGFAVVADEVRTLAQKTVKATGDIVSIITDLGQQTERMQALFSNGLELAKEGERSTGKIGDVMLEVRSSLAALTQEMDQVVVAIEQITHSTEGIDRQMQGIRDKNVAALTIGSELAEQNQRLAGVAESLAGLSRQFRV